MVTMTESIRELNRYLSPFGLKIVRKGTRYNIMKGEEVIREGLSRQALSEWASGFMTAVAIYGTEVHSAAMWGSRLVDDVGRLLKEQKKTLDEIKRMRRIFNQGLYYIKEGPKFDEEKTEALRKLLMDYLPENHEFASKFLQLGLTVDDVVVLLVGK